MHIGKTNKWLYRDTDLEDGSAIAVHTPSAAPHLHSGHECAGVLQSMSCTLRAWMLCAASNSGAMCWPTQSRKCTMKEGWQQRPVSGRSNSHCANISQHIDVTEVCGNQRRGKPTALPKKADITSVTGRSGFRTSTISSSLSSPASGRSVHSLDAQGFSSISMLPSTVPVMEL